MSWPNATLTEGAVDKPGSTETLYGCTFTHRYAEAGGLTWHAATAGGEGPVVLFLHGYPESWYAWHHQMAFLSASYRCIALDLPGYRQSEKPDVNAFDYDYANVAGSVAALLDALSIQVFLLVAHDRGAVIADHLCAVPGFGDRIIKYVRMQQLGCVPHGEPRPPHALFRSDAAVAAF
ncbi:alpha/beta fold hydrolase [Erythrobacter sp.]|jgi:alpha-beta hydrolase superfamily lysophospholipase|uniref:alpha/beta fold hydrolase n=1 Tax=Erythrobacter sp. TaxID=1042 RepID=UPI002ECD9812|nr:alpha/beta fold hydrolase [Erythrobacter sp.]